MTCEGDCWCLMDYSGCCGAWRLGRRSGRVKFCISLSWHCKKVILPAVKLCRVVGRQLVWITGWPCSCGGRKASGGAMRTKCVPLPPLAAALYCQATWCTTNTIPVPARVSLPWPVVTVLRKLGFLSCSFNHHAPGISNGDAQLQ